MFERHSYSGGKYAWFRPNGRAKRKLDRFLVSKEWINKWPTSIQPVLDINIFDHCPLLLKTLYSN